MIRLNRLTDYAIVVLGQLAQLREPAGCAPVVSGGASGEKAGDPTASRTAAQLAQDTGVPLPTVSKVLKMLAHGKIIASQRGVAGGYTLSRNPKAITVADIITAMEGPIALTACVDGAVGSCDVESLCAMRGNWDKVNRAIREALSAVTLQEMLAVPSAFEMFPPLAARRDDVRAQ